MRSITWFAAGAPIWRGLEASISAELEQLLSECPNVEAVQQTGQETASELTAIDQKIERLILALAESSDLSMPYINRTIERLEHQRQELLDRQVRQHAKAPKISHLRFEPLDFEQKKVVAAQFIREIRLENDSAEVVWNV